VRLDRPQHLALRIREPRLPAEAHEARDLLYRAATDLVALALQHAIILIPGMGPKLGEFQICNFEIGWSRDSLMKTPLGETGIQTAERGPPRRFRRIQFF
jgi:hypothetical protein